MRTETYGLNHPTDCPTPNELARSKRRAVLESLAIHDRVDPPGLRLDSSDFLELFERRRAGLVDHEILAVLHNADSDRCPFVRNGRREHELDRRILEDLSLIRDAFRARTASRELGSYVRLAHVERDKRTTTTLGRRDQPINVAMIRPDYREPDPLHFTEAR